MTYVQLQISCTILLNIYFSQINRPKRGEHQNTILKGLNDKRILFHPSSILSPEYKFSYPWVVYHLKQKSTNVSKLSIIPPLSQCVCLCVCLFVTKLLRNGFMYYAFVLPIIYCYFQRKGRYHVRNLPGGAITCNFIFCCKEIRNIY